MIDPPGADWPSLPSLLLSVFEQMTESVAIYDSAARYVYVNPAMASLLGRPAAELLGRCLWELYPDAKDNPFSQALRRVLAGGGAESLEHYYAPWDRWFDNRYYPVGAGACVVGHDITEAKRAEAAVQALTEELRASEARARRLRDSGVIGVVVWTRDGRLTDANDAFLRMVGYDRQDLAGGGLRWSDMTPPEFASLDERAFRELEEHGICAPFEKEYIAKDGRRVPILVGAATWEDTRESGVAWVLDRTEKRRAERERENALAREAAARRLAEEASRAKDEFLSTLSHELRTPLNAILGWANLLRTGALGEAQRERALETVERNARAQARLVEDMLDLSRIVQGKLVLAVGPVELVRVVEAAMDALRPAAEAKSITLQPVLDSHATIVGDEGRLQQVVWNLLSNAIKFTPKGGRVQVRLRRERSYVEVVVADNGAGIHKAFLPHVFDRFRQQDGAITRVHGGLGLGLAIVRSLVELHGGEVSAHSDGPGQGATFVVRLPMAPLRADREAPDAPSAPGEPPPVTFECPPALEGLRVLVVDDEPDTRSLLAFVLEQCKAEVHAVGSAAEALAALDQGRFDVLISDVGMPEEDGYSLIRKVRERPEARGGRVPALALTAYARGEDRSRALKAGFHMHLSKPIDPGELLIVVATLVGGYQAPMP